MEIHSRDCKHSILEMVQEYTPLSKLCVPAGVLFFSHPGCAAGVEDSHDGSFRKADLVYGFLCGCASATFA